MGSQEKVTVLITFYNNVQYVDQAMESVFMQETVYPFKVVVGDDGSTDGTIEKIKEWQSRYPDRIELVVQERNDTKKLVRGVRASRNRLSILKKVDTPYFIYLDGDDYWTSKDKIQKQVDILEKPENEDCVGCGHNIRMYYEGHNDVKETVIPGLKTKEGKWPLKKYWRSSYFHTNTILFRSKYIKNLPLDIVKDSFNDNLITFCFMKYGPLYFIRDCMADYRQNDGGLWANEREDICYIRELLAYDLECQVNPQMKDTCARRHIYHFSRFIENPDFFVNVEKEYLDIAKEFNCQTARRVLEEKHLFSDDFNADSKKVKILRFRCRIEPIHTLPFRVLRKVGGMIVG